MTYIKQRCRKCNTPTGGRTWCSECGYEWG